MENVKSMEPVPIFRARAGFWESVVDLWCPLPERVAKLGRANDIGKAVFYCSDSLETAVFEMRPRIGDLITVVRHEVVDPCLCPTVLGLGVEEKIDQYSTDSRHIPCLMKTLL